MNHINIKALLGLGGAAAIAIIIAAMVSILRQPESGHDATATYALPELLGHINEVKAVNIILSEDKPAVTLLNGDKGWKVQERENYPANISKIRELLIKLADAPLLEPKTSQENRYNDLGVEDLKSKEAKGVLIRLDGLNKPLELIIGNSGNGAVGTFIRRLGDKQSWLTSAQLTVDRSPVNWLDNTLLNFAADQIAEVSLTTSKGNTLRLFKNQASESDFQVVDLPAGQTLKSPAVANPLATTLTGLTLEDVASNQSLPLPRNSSLLKAHYRRFDGVNVEVTAWQRDNKDLARIAVNLDQAQADAAIQAELGKAKADYEAANKNTVAQAENKAAESEGKQTSAPLAVVDPAKFRQQRLDELNLEVDKLNQRLQGWTFTISVAKYANMDKSINDLLNVASVNKPSAGKPQQKK